MIFTASQKHQFYSELAKLLEAGFGIREAAAVMLESRLPKVQSELLRQVDLRLVAGKTIANAFSENTPAISELERGVLTAGERGGRLGIAFQHLADYFGLVASSRREMLKALIYPVVLLHLGIFVGTVPKAIMAGETGKVFAQLVGTLLIVYAVTFLIVVGVFALLKIAPTNPVVDRLLNFIPWVGKARRHMALSRFTKVYHIGLLAGISVNENLNTSIAAARSGVIRTDGIVLNELAKNGEKLGPGFVASVGFPKAFARSYMTGEEAGTLDTDFAKWSTFYQDEATRSIRTLSVALPKVLYFLVLIYIGWQIIGFYNGYLQQLESIVE